MGQKMLKALAMLSFQHHFIQTMPDFNDKDRHANFLFK
jgi:hypothetical protein